jgi:hypothetical protein
MFKVGDRVRLGENCAGFYSGYKGRTGTITEIDHHDKQLPYAVEFDPVDGSRYKDFDWGREGLILIDEDGNEIERVVVQKPISPKAEDVAQPPSVKSNVALVQTKLAQIEALVADIKEILG